jgi:hypothetical protein
VLEPLHMDPPPEMEAVGVAAGVVPVVVDELPVPQGELPAGVNLKV